VAINVGISNAHRLGSNRRVDSVTYSEDFNTFIEHVVERLPDHLSPEFARYIGPPSRPIEFIGRFEMLVDDLVRGLREADENFDEQILRSHPPDNVNDYARFPAVYRRNVAARLAESEHAVIDRFYASEPIPARLVAPPEPFEGGSGNGPLDSGHSRSGLVADLRDRSIVASPGCDRNAASVRGGPPRPRGDGSQLSKPCQ
jgi:hypothetical protein